ncbi:hypothetical protein AQUCO_00900726v1 [Aquilegia coerulea]|uniref:Late embryogenesis abundant protein LEA-2 subgroup domain-containing protein n=1 Tax=Aquilegia coerulea TaxID=218851 RepID=A0A2G5EF50_AQUCA|nr:hypothetical protein AQUCO_00900726v1 [Aquilegia coerulea]
MSQTQDVPLNDAYYGPSVPPQKPQRKRSRGCCVLSTFLKVIISIIVILGIAALIFWLVVRPTEVKFYVVGAELKEFNLTNGNTLINYDLSMNITVRNPNKRVGLYYDQLDAIASYKGERFGWANMPRFYQGHKNTTNLRADFSGQQLVLLNTFEINQFNQDKNDRYFYIDVKLYSRIRFKIGALKTRRVKPDIECHLRIPLVSNGSFSMFETTRCDVDF